MTNIFKIYKKNELVPFSLCIGWNSKKNKKELVMPINWASCNKDNYKSFINDTIINKEGIININNCLGVKMGTTTKDNYKIIGVDIDDKNDDIENNIFNGLKKWDELLKEHNINNRVSLNTFIQQTGNNGYHYLFKVTLKQYETIKNITGLIINGTSYSIDVKANENSFLIVEPSNYNDNNDNNRYYKWLKNDNIDIIPEWIYNLIKIQDKKEKVEVNEIIKKKEIGVIKCDEVITISTELEQLKPLFKLLKKERVNAYKLWFNLSCLIKSLYGDDGINILLEISRNSTHYENDEYIINKYENEIKKKSYTINTFYYWLKQDNPKAYQQYLKNKKMDKLLVDVIEINDEYLLEINDDELNNDTIINNKIKEFVSNESIKSFNLKSTYNTGKTQFMKTIIKKYNFKKILWVTYRQSLTNDIKGNFKELEFKSYMDGIYNANRQIIQLESLLKIGEYEFFDEEIDIPSYDLVILDEIEGILSHVTNDKTFNGKNKDVFTFLENIILCSKKLITMDGDTSNRTYNFINNFGSSINIINTVKKNKKIFNFIDNKQNYKNLIYKELDDNKKIVIVSQSKKDAEALKIEIENKYNELTILIYTGMTSDNNRIALEEVNKIWVNCDVLIYSPTIEAGVNFDVVHFDKIFGIIAPKTSCQRAFMQMLARVRKTTDNEIYILNADFKLNEINEYYTFYDAYEASKEMSQFKLNRTYDINKKSYKMTYSNYLTNYLYNVIEDKNKENYYFLSKLVEMMINKGHEVKFINDDIKNNEVEIVNEKDEKILNEFYLKVVNAELVNKIKYQNLLQLKNSNNASEKDKILITKKYFSDALGTDNLSYDNIKLWYYNLDKIKNYRHLLDISTFIKNDEIKNEIAYEKVILIKDILNNLGFIDIIDNNKFITADELETKFNEIYKNNKIYNCKKSSKLFFNSSYFKLDDKTTIKSILGHLNTLLNDYSIKITQKRLRIKSIRENVYYIEILNEVDDILKRTTNKNKKIDGLASCPVNVI